MARPLRLEFPGAIYHLTARGDRREDIFSDDADRERLLQVFAECVGRFGWACHAYCLMANHYHFLVETPLPNLARGMRQLNGIYTQRFNRRHGRVGHLFQGRYQAILIEKDSYLQELARYVVLNPLRARLVKRPEQWRWSSYRASAGMDAAPPWLATDWLLEQFARRRKSAQGAYVRFVAEGLKAPSIWGALRGQIFLGREGFAARMIAAGQANLSGIPRVQRRPTRSLAAIARDATDPHEAMATAYASGAYSLSEIGQFFGKHYSTVSRVARKRSNR
jgi:putative transposase